MPTAISGDERLDRAEKYLSEVSTLLKNEPSAAHAHGEWIVKIRSRIGHADDEIKYAKRRGCDRERHSRLDRWCDQVWNEIRSKMRR